MVGNSGGAHLGEDAGCTAEGLEGSVDEDPADLAGSGRRDSGAFVFSGSEDAGSFEITIGFDEGGIEEGVPVVVGCLGNGGEGEKARVVLGRVGARPAEAAGEGGGA